MWEKIFSDASSLLKRKQVKATSVTVSNAAAISVESHVIGQTQFSYKGRSAMINFRACFAHHFKSIQYRTVVSVGATEDNGLFFRSVCLCQLWLENPLQCNKCTLLLPIKIYQNGLPHYCSHQNSKHLVWGL